MLKHKRCCARGTRLSLVFATLSLLLGVINSLNAQPFTYQGHLRDGGLPANGTYSMTFHLFSVPSGGTALATVGPVNVAVSNGLFTTELNFGNVWDGSDRYLEIQVGSTVLSPRVKMNPTPYAIRATTAGTANPIGAAGGDLSSSYPNPTVAKLQGRAVVSTAPSAGQVLKWNGSAWSPNTDLRDAFWQPSGNNIYYITGNVGIGTNIPNHRLHVETDTGNRALYGLHTATSGTTFGVYGRSDSTTGRGVFGWASATSGPTYGVAGLSDSSTGYGVYSMGRFAATGTKSFQIDHPLHPENAYLNHFCTEGPEPYNAYSGNLVTDARGYATVQLPDYFESINRDFRYQLTVIDGAGEEFVQARVVRKIQNNQFVIRTSKPFVEVSWRVEAIRNDLWVQKYGFKTEQEKEDAIKGKYLHPKLYGQPKEQGIHYHPEPERPNETEKPK